jgi:hypothetical protein
MKAVSKATTKNQAESIHDRIVKVLDGLTIESAKIVLEETITLLLMTQTVKARGVRLQHTRVPRQR